MLVLLGKRLFIFFSPWLFQAYTINPSTRYRAIPKKIEHERILELYDTDAKEEFEFLKEKFVGKQVY